jgi:hypothetical protein
MKYRLREIFKFKLYKLSYEIATYIYNNYQKSGNNLDVCNHIVD